MYHSLVQQVVRGDIWYWLLYSMIRKVYTFVSYPYYTKYAKKGDNAAFKHVDLNLHAAITTSVGAEIIQGSASFINKDHRNCTLLLKCKHSWFTNEQMVYLLSGTDEKAREATRKFLCDSLNNWYTSWSKMDIRDLGKEETTASNKGKSKGKAPEKEM